MKLLYYPGCTLHTVAVQFDQSTKEICKQLDIELIEISDFTCCGGLYPQTTENLMQLQAPARILVQAQRTDPNLELMTLCTFCYNTLKRTHYTLKKDEQKRNILNDYLEEPYNAKVKIVHLIEVFRDDIGYDTIRKKSKRSLLKGFRVAPYYGCLLLRPMNEIELDDQEQPSILEDLLYAIGCDVIEFPYRFDCCGSFHVVNKPEIAEQCSKELLRYTEQFHANCLVTCCPLCYYNISRFGGTDFNFQIFYITQLVGLALGIEPIKLGLDPEIINKFISDSYLV